MNDSTALDALPDENFRLPENGNRAMAVLTLQARQRDLEVLYESHASKFAGYFRAAGVTEAVARELAQDTFVLALRNLHQFKEQAKLSTWLWTIASNVLKTHWRSLKPHDGANWDEPVDPDTLTVVSDERLTGMCDCVRRGFAVFGAEHPERALAVYLSVVEDYSTEQLAQALGRTAHAAAEYLSQSKARLRPYIKDCDER